MDTMELTVVALIALVALVLVAGTVLLTRGRAESERLAAAVARTQLEEARRQIGALTEERDRAVARRDAALDAAHAAGRELELMAQRLKDGEARAADMERLKTEGLQQMKAAALETTQLLSSKLLEDHKRESEAAKKDGEALVKQATAELFQRFES